MADSILDQFVRDKCDTSLRYMEDHYFLGIYGQTNNENDKPWYWDPDKLEQYRNRYEPEHRVLLLRKYISHFHRNMTESENPEALFLNAGAPDDGSDPRDEEPYSPNMLLSATQIRMFLNQNGSNLKYYLADTLDKQQQLHDHLVSIQKDIKKHPDKKRDDAQDKKKMQRLMGNSHVIGPLPQYLSMIGGGQDYQCNPEVAAWGADTKEQMLEETDQFTFIGSITEAVLQKTDEGISYFINEITASYHDFFVPMIGAILPEHGNPLGVNDAASYAYASVRWEDVVNSLMNKTNAFDEYGEEISELMEEILPPGYSQVIMNLEEVHEEMFDGEIFPYLKEGEGNFPDFESLNEWSRAVTDQFLEMNSWERIWQPEIAPYTREILEQILRARADLIVPIVVEKTMKQLVSKFQACLDVNCCPESGYEGVISTATTFKASETREQCCAEEFENTIERLPSDFLPPYDWSGDLPVWANVAECIWCESEGIRGIVAKFGPYILGAVGMGIMLGGGVAAAEAALGVSMAGGIVGAIGTFAAFLGPIGWIVLGAAFVITAILLLLHRKPKGALQSTNIMFINAVSTVEVKEIQDDTDISKTMNLVRPVDLFIQDWKKEYISNQKEETKDISDLYMKGAKVRHFTAGKPLAARNVEEKHFCGLTAPVPTGSLCMVKDDGNQESHELQLYTCGFLSTERSTDGVGGMVVFSVADNPCHDAQCIGQDPQIKRRLAFSFHGKDNQQHDRGGVCTKILEDSEYEQGQNFDRGKLYDALYKNAKRDLYGHESESDQYYLHTKFADPSDDNTFGIAIAMHKNSNLYKQWKEDEKLAPEFTI